MEYYELCKLDETVSSKKQNPFASKHPFRLGVAGTSESEKTKIVAHLLLGTKYLKIYPWMSGKKCGHKIPKGGSKNFGERYIPYDNLIVVAQHRDEELWEAVQCFYEFIAMDKQAPWYENVRFKLITPEKLPDISSFKRTGRFTVIVFDDLAGEPLATQLKIIPFFRSGRHEGISTIYIAQRFYKLHQNIRKNLKYILLHCGCGTLDSIIKRILKDMYDDYESLAKKVCEVIKKHFVVIDIRRPSDDPYQLDLDGTNL